MIKSQAAGEEWAAVGPRRDIHDTKPNPLARVMLERIVDVG